MTDILQRVILENQEMIAHKRLVYRNYSLHETSHITILTGIRRCGKTYMLYQIAQGIRIEQVLFLDFEDERLLPLNSFQSYDIIIDSYKILFPDVEPVLFFDEIQNLDKWHLYLKRLHVKGYKIYVTGSNANLLSREIATYLKGRSFENVISPFSFSEFLKLKGIELDEKDPIINQPKILNLFNDYLEYGGFPEVIKATADEKRAVAKNIYNLLFYKDLVVKYDKNDYLMKLIVNKIAENITKDFSITSLANKIKPIYNASVPTITDYFNILPEPYLTANIYQYRNSFVQRESKRKTYLTDNSFIFLNRIAPDRSRLFENLVFNYLQWSHERIFYYKTNTGKEVDFFINTAHTKELIQVCYNLESLDTKNREIVSLMEAMKEQELDTAYVYTYNTSEIIKSDDKSIKIIPFWKLMLQH